MMLDKISEVLKKSSRIAILPHIAADGDALGSSLALVLALKKLNKAAIMFVEEEIPQLYNFLPGLQYAEVYTSSNMKFDAAVAIDAGDAERLAKRFEIFDNSIVTINIDHHSTNTEFAIHNYVDTKAAATGEIIYNLINLLCVEYNMDIATCLYVAIATDTGGFRFTNTTSHTHSIVAELLKEGVNVGDISQRVFDSTSYEKVRLLGKAADSLELLDNGKIALISITNEMIRKVGAKEEDCDGIVSIGRNIRGVKVAVMLRQLDNGEIKVNLRSSSEFDVSLIAGMYSGGGHKKAAGYTTRGSLEEAKNMLLKDIREAL